MEQNGLLLTRSLCVTHLISAFYWTFSPDFRYDGESHPGWEFVYVQSGSITVTADDMTYVLHSGEMVCHKPHEFHCLRPYHGEAATIILCFSCTGEAMRRFQNRIFSVSGRQRQLLYDIAALGGKLFLPKTPLEIARDGRMDPSPDATELQCQCMQDTIELLLLSLMQAHTTARQQRVGSYEQQLSRETLVSDVIRYLQTHMSEPVRLPDLAAQFPYSLSSIKRLFREETGCGVMEYLSQMRLEQAKELLRTTALSLSEIAAHTGFTDASYLSVVFRRRMGVSPGRWRDGQK